MYTKFALFILLSLLPRFTLAQPAPAPPPPEREGSAEFAFVGTTGNSSTQTFGVGGEFIYRPSGWESKAKVSYVKSKADDQLRAEAFVLAVRVQRQIWSRLAGYGQYGYQRDRFAGILNRNVAEGGLAYSLLQLEHHKLLVDAGVGYANEERVLGNNLSTATLGGGGLYKLKISDTSELSEDGHFVLSLSDGNDWRYTNTAALTAKISTVFSIKVSNAVRYLNLPVAGFKKTDAVTSVALVAKF